MRIKFLLRIILKLFIFIFLTLTTQIGGIVYLITLLLISSKSLKYILKRTVLFCLLYVTTTFLIIPRVAPIFGRVKIKNTQHLQAHNFITILFNRNYVTTKMDTVLTTLSLRVIKEYPSIKIIYLDANFPFINGFSLLPHLSHNDGKKIDISFIYQTKKGIVSNLKPSNSGYGIFVTPLKNEIHQTKICKKRGYWQYDFTKYFTLGNANTGLKISEKTTRNLINQILKNNAVSKVFIEPHLIARLKLQHSKIRFHGCGAVRHDDHIHFQIK